MEEHENEGARGVEDGGRAPEGRVISVPAGEGCAFRIERVWLTTNFASHELQQQVEQAREEGLYFAWVREVAVPAKAAEVQAARCNCAGTVNTCPACAGEAERKPREMRNVWRPQLAAVVTANLESAMRAPVAERRMHLEAVHLALDVFAKLSGLDLKVEGACAECAGMVNVCPACAGTKGKD